MMLKKREAAEILEKESTKLIANIMFRRKKYESDLATIKYLEKVVKAMDMAIELLYEKDDEERW